VERKSSRELAEKRGRLTKNCLSMSWRKPQKYNSLESEWVSTYLYDLKPVFILKFSVKDE